MTYEVMPLPFKPPRLKGLSERLLASHYENNYGGALRRLNAIEQRLAALDWGTDPVFEINGLKREELIASGSVILHEVYFEGLGGPGGDPGQELAAAIERDFGSVARWRAAFTTIAKALAGGSGWVLLTWSPRLGRLVNQRAADHAHSLAGAVPVLALDMYEHAYAIDFGANAAAYVDAYMANLHWERIRARFQRATVASANQLEATPEQAPITAERVRDLLDTGTITVLDVCLAEDLAKRSDMVPGALLRAPERIADWACELPRDRPVIVYCVYGFQVSGEAAAELRRRGIDARIMAGGIAAWHAIGAPVDPLALS